MSENEIRAMRYSEKCERRRARQAKRRVARIEGVIHMLFPFSIGCLAMACLISAFV